MSEQYDFYVKPSILANTQPSHPNALVQLIRNAGVAGALLLGRDILAVAVQRARDVSEYAMVDTSAMVQILYVGLCLCYVVYYLGRYYPAGVVYLLKSTPASLLLVYTGLCAVSCLWSVDLPVTAYRSMECLCFLLLIAMVCDNLSVTCGSRQDMIEWLVLWSMWVLFWDTLRLGRMMGFGTLLFSIEVFRCGAFALGMLFFLTIFISRRKIFIVISLLYMPLSLANKTYFGVFFGLLGGLWAGDRRFQIASVFLFGTLALMVLGFGSIALQNTLFYGQGGVGMNYTTGRTGMWSYSLEVGAKRLLCGYGFVAGETSALWALHLPAISTHNAFLSALLAIGIVGPILLIAFFVWLFSIVIRADLPDHWRPAFIGTAIMIFVISSAAPGLGTRVYGSWIPAVLASMAMVTIAKWDHLAIVNGVVRDVYPEYGGVLTGQELV